VYFDETGIVLVRRAGNDEPIARATAAFAPLQQAIETELLAPVTSWQWPAGHARALRAYSDILALMGRPGGHRFLVRFLEVGGVRDEERRAALALVDFYVTMRDPDRARVYLERAATIDPADPDVSRWRARLGR
jgi:hypothetical protein